MAIALMAAITNNPMIAWFLGVTGGVAAGSAIENSLNSKTEE